MSDLEDLTRDYRTGFLRYLPQRGEAALTAGYELGRRAAAGRAGLLDLIQVYHRVLGEALEERRTTATGEVLDAACEFLSEVLSTFEMAHRVLHDTGARPPDAG
jgi:hypothetical protein